MESADIGSWIEIITGEQDENLLLEAKKEYQKYSGTVFQDDKSYESRMGLFLEWFILNFPIPHSGKVPIAQYIETNGEKLDPSKRTFLEGLFHPLHGIFRVNQVNIKYVRVHELFEEKEFRITESRGNLLFNKNDLFEGNLFQLESGNLFTGNFVYHPQAAVKFIKSKVKAVRVLEKESTNKFKLREKEVHSLQKKLEGVQRNVTKLEVKIENSTKPHKREKLEIEHKEKLQEQSSLKAELNKSEQILADFQAGEMGTELKNRRFELIQRLSYMSLKWERSRQIDLHDIYSD